MHFAFNPTKFEREWLPVYLGHFAQEEWFTKVLYRVKGGKEAQVYCCEGHPSTGFPWLAAKVYRPRKSRAMRNDAIYKEGRAFFDDGGKMIRDQRRMRALRNKSKLGRQLDTVSWIQHEFQTMSTLYEIGADVPKPLVCSEHAILMEYVGDADEGAPTLHEVRLKREEAGILFERILQNIEWFLLYDRIHADLSAYNILYWDGICRIIDFPQAVEASANSHAFSLLVRDLERVCRYFQRYGVDAWAMDLAEGLWQRYLRGTL